MVVDGAIINTRNKSITKGETKMLERFQVIKARMEQEQEDQQEIIVAAVERVEYAIDEFVEEFKDITAQATQEDFDKFLTDTDVSLSDKIAALTLREMEKEDGDGMPGINMMITNNRDLVEQILELSGVKKKVKTNEQ